MNLSPEQKLAVEYTSGPQIILAGPGSGKTLVIVEKAAYLAEHLGLKPEQSLILTYNSMTAEELNARLRKREQSVPLPEARTFHSYGQKIVQRYFHCLGYKNPPEVADSYRQYQLQRQAYFQSASIPPGLTNPDTAIDGIKSFISRACDELVSPGEILDYVACKQNELPSILDPDQRELERQRLEDLRFAATFYDNYEKLKTANDIIDFDDMLFGLYRIFAKNPDVLAAERCRLKYILVDEFQDANSGQVETLGLLARNSGKICVVGDDDQSIYRFRGASYGSFVNFKKHFENAVTHKLTTNYRSAKPIVTAAHALITHKTQKRYEQKKFTRAHIQTGDKVGVFISPDTRTEARRVTALIQDILKNNPKLTPDNIAVISRAHDHRREIRNNLTMAQIPVVDQRPIAIFSVFEVNLLAAILRGALADDSPDWLFPILLRYAPGLSPVIYTQINDNLKTISPFDVIQDLAKDERVGPADKSGLSLICGILTEIRAAAPELTASGLVEKALISTGLLSDAVADNESGDLKARALTRLWAVVSEYEDNHKFSPREFLQFLIWIQANENIALEPSSQSGVRLLSAHSAKGLEFPVVIIVGLSERKFPQDDRPGRFEFPQELSKEIEPPPDAYIQEERRLMYVAMTRAARRLYLSGIERSRVKISRFFTEVIAQDNFPEYGKEIVFQDTPDEPSPREDTIPLDLTESFAAGLAEIIGGLVGDSKARLTTGIPLLVQNIWNKLSVEGKYENPEEFKHTLIDIISNCRLEIPKKKPVSPKTKPMLSYTDIKVYDSCPLQYRFKKILKVPEKAGPQMFLGDAIHRTLQEAMQKKLEGIPLDIESLQTDFREKWQKYTHSDSAWMESLKAAGLKMIETFVENEKTLTTHVLALERSFKIERDNFILSGRIDRVDTDDSGELYIIDYKTGKIGMPDSSYESKKDDQLIIYAMVCPELFGKLPARVSFYYLSEGRLVSQVVSQKEIDKLQEKITETANRIAAEDFTATTNRFTCGICSYRAICPSKAE
jgi:DNA helicase-2/ATP-dependent DNA helicase PcrA